MRIPIATSSSQGRSIPLTAERLVNMYAEKAPAGAKSPVVVLGCPGLTRFCDIDVRRTRGLYRTPADGRLYAVVRNTLYHINSDGVATGLGTIDGAGRVGMSDNGLQLCIVTGSSGYTYSVTDGLQQITDDGFPGAETVTFLDGYFIFNNSTPGQRGQFFISNLLDGQTYDATDFATAESYPDNLLRVFADHSQLLLFGSETIEIWFNAGVADFPFARAQGSVIEQGLGARWSVAKLDETVVWLDNEGMVRRLEGSTPVRISTHAIEYDISRGDWQNASAWSYVEEGHQFYVLTVPARDLATQKAGTYVFDAATQLWHDRKSYRKDYSRSGFYARAYGKHITADIDIGRLYVQSLDVYEEDGEHLIAEMQFPQVQNDGKRFIVHRLQLDMEVSQFDRIETETKTKDLSLSSFEVSSIDIGGQEANPAGIFFRPDGLSCYIVGTVADTVFQYSLSTPWDVSTLAYSGISFSVAAQASSSPALALSDSGDKLFVLNSFLGNDNLFQYTLSTPWDISSATYDGIAIPSGFSSPAAIWFAENGTKLYISGPSAESISSFSLGTPWDISSAVDDGADFNHGKPQAIGLSFSSDGFFFLLLDTFGVVYEYKMTSAFSILTATETGVTFDTSGQTGTAQEIFIGNNDNNFYVVGPGNGHNVDQYIYGTREETNIEIVNNARVMLDESGNTRTWGMNQNWRSMGKKGEYDKRVIWRRRGQRRSYTPRIAISAPVKRAVFACYVDIEPQNS